MTTLRRFLIASSLARLVRKERGSARVTEGYFASQTGRNSHVQVEGGQCHLVLVTAQGDATAEERTEVPRAHADALLEVCPGKAVYDRSRLSLAGGREIFIDRFSAPGPFDLISVAFENQEEARKFSPPAWFGTEVTGKEGYDNRAVALQGAPKPEDVPLSNQALDALLDLLENRFGLTRLWQPQRAAPNDDAKVIDALRLLANPAPEPQAPPASSPDATEAPPAAPQTSPESRSSKRPQIPARPPAPTALSAATPDTADARIDDVLEGLSQVLESYAEAPAEGAATAVLQVEPQAASAQRSEA